MKVRFRCFVSVEWICYLFLLQEIVFMSEIVLTLPDNLAQEARNSGLLKPEVIASLFRAEIRRRRVNKLFAAADRLADLDTPVTEEEIEAEIASVRQERR
jgi:hypothetical protein